MPGLIPLRMSTLISPSKITFSFSEDNKSDYTSWEPTPYRPRTHEMEHRRAARERVVPEPLMVHKPAPTTPAQWKKALAEVKREFANRKYRQCSMRCTEILDDVKDSVSHNAHAKAKDFVAVSLTRLPPRTSQKQHASSTSASMPPLLLRCKCAPYNTTLPTGQSSSTKLATTIASLLISSKRTRLPSDVPHHALSLQCPAYTLLLVQTLQSPQSLHESPLPHYPSARWIAV